MVYLEHIEHSMIVVIFKSIVYYTVFRVRPITLFNQYSKYLCHLDIDDPRA